MSLSAAPTLDRQHAIIADACERNLSAHLTFASDERQNARTRVRLLRFDERELLIDHPRLDGKPIRLTAGMVIRLTFVWEKQMLGLSTTVRGRRQIEHGGVAAVPTIVLDPPSRLERIQRRECYRLSVLHLPEIAVELTHESNDSPLSATLVNLSENGCGIMTHLDSADASYRVGRRFRIRFALPDESEPFSLEGTIRWLVRESAEDRLTAGIGWELDWGNHQDRSVQTRLSKFIVAEQRRKLKNRPGAQARQGIG